MSDFFVTEASEAILGEIQKTTLKRYVGYMGFPNTVVSRNIVPRNRGIS